MTLANSYLETGDSIVNRIRGCVVLAFSACTFGLCPDASRAQIPTAGLKDIQDINLFLTGGLLNPSSEAVTAKGWGGGTSNWGIVGWGFEMSFDLSPDTANNILELAVGYSQIGSLRSGISGFDFRGALRTLPAFSVYYTFGTEWSIDPFVFGSTGFTTFSNVRVYDAQGRVYGVGGETIVIGLGFGLVHRSNVFVEAAYRFRQFPSLDYRPPSGITSLPPELPRGLGLDALEFSVGYQVTLRK